MWFMMLRTAPSAHQRRRDDGFIPTASWNTVQELSILLATPLTLPVSFGNMALEQKHDVGRETTPVLLSKASQGGLQLGAKSDTGGLQFLHVSVVVKAS